MAAHTKLLPVYQMECQITPSEQFKIRDITSQPSTPIVETQKSPKIKKAKIPKETHDELLPLKHKRAKSDTSKHQEKKKTGSEIRPSSAMANMQNPNTEESELRERPISRLSSVTDPIPPIHSISKHPESKINYPSFTTDGSQPTRAQRAQLFGAGFEPVIDHSGTCVPSTIFHEIAKSTDELNSNLNQFQKRLKQFGLTVSDIELAWLGLTWTNTSNAPTKVYLTFQFFSFPCLTSEDLSVAGTNVRKSQDANIVQVFYPSKKDLDGIRAFCFSRSYSSV